MTEDRRILTREFSLEDVLTMETGYVLSPRRMDAVYEFTEWMAGVAVFTHQLPQVGRVIEAALKKQFPQLDIDKDAELAADVDWLRTSLQSGDDKAVEMMWRRLKERYGKSFQVAPLEPFDDVPDSPFDGLDMNKVIVVQTSSGDEFPKHLDS